MDRHIPLRSLPVESLEERRCLAVCFAAANHDVDVADVANISATYLTDVDADGDTDIVFRAETSVGWYENTNGLGHFAEPLRLQTHGETPRFIAEVDGDGDSDLITSAPSPADLGA